MKDTILYNKNARIADVKLDEDGNAVSIDNKNYKKFERFLPVCLQGEGAMTPEAFNTWMGKRHIPEKREGLLEAREEFPGFDRSNKNRNRFSLTDQYWLQFHPRESWETMNFFTNRYAQEPGRIFFEPWNVTKEEALQRSPDITTNGNLRKRWEQDPETLVSSLIKAGNDDEDKDSALLQRPLCEVLASMMLEKIGFRNFVRYELCIYGLKICSKCRNFIDENTEFIPMAEIAHKYKRTEEDRDYLKYLERICKNYDGIKIRNDLINMVAADYIVGNFDRHLGNFGLIRDTNTGHMKGFAPLFDFGSAYWWSHEEGVISKSYNLFKGKHRDCVEKFFQNRWAASIEDIDVTDMKELIGIYPYLSHAKKDQMKGNIDDTIRRIQKIGKERSLVR